MTPKPRPRKPLIAVQHDMHPLLKEIADRQRDKLEVVVDELLVAGLRVKRLLPEGFRTEQSTERA